MKIVEVFPAENEKDLHILRDLHEKSFQDTAPQPNYYEGWWWIVYIGKTPVAFCGMHPSAEAGKLTAYFIRAGVIAKYRGRGIQTSLIRVRESKAKKLGIKILLSDTTGNPVSSNNLIKSKFKVYSPKRPWGMDSTIYWIKNLG